MGIPGSGTTIIMNKIDVKREDPPGRFNASVYDRSVYRVDTEDMQQEPAQLQHEEEAPVVIRTGFLSKVLTSLKSLVS